MPLSSHAIVRRCHNGFLLSLGSFAIVIGAMLAASDASPWLADRGRQTLALAPCLAFIVGALAPAPRSARASAFAGAALALALCAALALFQGGVGLGPSFFPQALAALAPAWVALALCAPLGFAWGLLIHHSRFDPALARPKTLRLSAAPGALAEPGLPRRLAALVEGALPSPLWVALPTESGGLRMVEPLSGAVCSIEPLVFPQEEQARLEPESHQAPSEWLLSLAWEPGFHPRRQWRGAAAERSLELAQAGLLEGLAREPGVLSASAIS